MGTVGLSFGSPTSGAGFNVSTTVSEIVANLQNVETPWKTQLTKLQAQDTAISSLGTLFSNLSNDMSALTDLQGTMATKTGSSSDTNVLTLTAATSSAVAGTHTVEVSNLALTSSGFLPPVSSASALLTGSITLQVGASGTAQTITLNSSDDSLNGLAAAINSSAVGVTASVLTDASGSRLSLVSGTSGADGNLTVSGNTLAPLLNFTGAAATSTVNSTGELDSVPSLSDALSGSLSIQVGTGTAQTITLGSSGNTLTGLENAINTTPGLGVTASIVTNSDGSSSLSLVSDTAGTAGNLTVNSTIANTTAPVLAYTGAAGTNSANSTGTLASIANAGDALAGSLSIQVGSGSVQTVTLDSSDNTLAGLANAINNTSGIGVTASVVTNPDGTSSLSLVSNTAGTAGTLSVNSTIVDTATPALGYTSAVAGKDANLTVDGINLTSSSNTVANLIPGVTFQLTAPSSAGEQVQVVIGNDNAGVESTITQLVSDYNSLISGMNAQEGLDSSNNAEPLFGSPTLTLLQQQLLNGINKQNPNGYLAEIPNGLNTTLTGTLSIQTAGGITQDFTMNSTNNTLSGLASAVNAANMGVTATVVTNSDGTSNISLLSQTAGSAGALAVTSNLVATSDTALSYSSSSTSTNSSGTLTSIANTGDTLAGSISIQVGSGASQTIALGSSNNTLAGLESAINAASIGVTASIVTNGDGSSSLSLLSNTAGTAGDLTVTSSILDATNTTTTPVNYTSSSDINSLTSLGMSINNDGSITFDATSLDSVLNTDYSGVVGFFQNSNSWGQSFANTITSAGTSSSTGILSLASSSNSSVESTLNADISKEQSLISAQQTSLTAELNSANEIMEQLPTQLEGVSELYSAITGYNQQTNG